MSYVTVNVGKETKAELEKLKVASGARSMDAVLKGLLAKRQDRDPPVVVEEENPEQAAEAEKRRKINVREPLYSLETLSERSGMLEYLTGFDRSGVDLLIRRFDEVSVV